MARLAAKICNEVLADPVVGRQLLSVFEGLDSSSVTTCFAIGFAQADPELCIVWMCTKGDLEGLYGGRVVAMDLEDDQYDGSAQMMVIH